MHNSRLRSTGSEAAMPANGLDNFERQNRHSRRRAENSYKDPQHFLQNDLTQNHENHSNGNGHSTSGTVAGAHDFLSRRPPTNNGNAPGHHPTFRNGSNNRVIIVEPSPSTTPALSLNMRPGTGTDSITTDEMLADSTQSMLRLGSLLGGSELRAGRASAPPQLFLSQSAGLFSNKLFEDKNPTNPQNSRSQSRGGSAVGMPLSVDLHPNGLSSSRTPIPSFEKSNGQFSVKLQSVPSASTTPVPEDPVLKDLSRFVWDASDGNFRAKDIYPSRALAIFGLTALQLSEVKSTCEAFGSLLYFRSEFFYSKGLLLIAYHDLRSARHAAGELRSYLQQMIAGSNDVQSAATEHHIKVLFSVSLTSSFERDGSTLVISGVPPHISDQDVSDLLSSTYGELRSVQCEAPGCLIVEFYDIQDADQALLEIQSAKPWGAGVSVSSKMRQDYERKRGKDFLALIGEWRQSSKHNNLHSSQSSTFPPQNMERALDSPSKNIPTHVQQNVGVPSPTMSQDSRHSGVHTQSTASSSTVSAMMLQPTTQLVIGPDGQYSYVMVQSQSYPAPGVNPQYGSVTQQMQPVQQHVVSGPHGTYIANPYDGQGYWVQQQLQPMANPGVPQYMPVSSNHTGMSHHQPMVDMHHGQTIPMFNPVGPSHGHIVDSSVSSGNTSLGNGSSPRQSKDDNDTKHLSLDIELVKSGGDKRTSLMVRNIPNKYTQSMLISEFQETGHGPGNIDFFYLPIDFRNKCNRGYAFINFVDYSDIVSFYDAYNGKHWKVFKSDKICCITYARIQGKESMMKRFQNSALMEKDQEYRPLVFTPNGDLA